MKAILRLTDPSRSGAAVQALVDAIDGDVPRKQILENGVLVSGLQPAAVKTFTDQLAQHKYSAYQATEDSVRLNADVEGTDGLIKILIRVLGQQTDLAKILWATGLTLETATAHQANDLKKRLEAAGADVTLVEPSIDEYTVSGHVRRADNTPFTDSGYTLQGFDQLAVNNTVSLGAPVSLQADGNYRISYSWESTDGRNGPNLVLRLHNPEGEVVAEATRPVASRQETLNLQVDVRVPDPEPEKEDPKTFDVRGRITDANGNGQEGIWVKAFDQGVDREALLGRVETNDDGTYHIDYTSDDRTASNKDCVALIVRVTSQRGDNDPIATSPLFLNARDHEVVNLLIGNEPYRGRTEYERVETALAPRLASADLAAMDTQSVAVLACQTGLAPLQVAHYLKAQREAARTQVAAEPLYGFYRKGLPTSLSRLVAQDTPLLERTLVAAAAAHVISAKAEAQAVETVASLVAFGAHVAVQENAPEGRAIREVLDLAGLQTIELERFIGRYTTNEAPMPAFWAGVTQDLGEEKTARLQTTLQFTALTLNNPSLVRVLQGANEIRQPRDLVSLGASDWEGLLQDGKVTIPDRVAGDTPTERRRAYATALTHSVEAAFPTAVFAHRWRQADGTMPTVPTFLDQNLDFRLGTHRVGKYLAEHPDALTGIDDPEALADDLRGVERLYRLAPRFDAFEHVYPLFRDGVRSSYQIKTMGRKAVMAYSTEKTAETYALLYDRAVHASNVALNAYFNFSPKLNGVPMYVLPHSGIDAIAAGDPLPDEEGSADLEALFGAQDYCACAHCSSVLSPSAYLTDLLAFLDGAAARGGDTGLEKLFERRPDLGNLDLTCENSHTPLPYIDLVNEVLENAIHPRAYTTETHGGTTLSISDEVPQTEGEAETLRANPEHLNTDAYDTLDADDTIYPWNLPFSLWREEAAVYLDHLGVPRHELLALFRPSATLSRAAEYLGLLNPDVPALADPGVPALANEVTLLTTSAPSDAALERAWGVPISRLAEPDGVLTFARQAELDYDGVKELLETRFINEDGRLAVAFADDAPCSLAEADFNDLTNSRLDRIHRFVRLQRRLGWTAVELDQALTALGAPDITTALIEQLADLQRLRHRFNKFALPQLLTWWSPALGVMTYEDTPSLYEQVFLNRSVHQVTEIEELFGLNDAGTELRTPRSLTDEIIAGEPVTPLVLGAVGLTEADVSLLIADELGGDGAMTLASLSHLYRVATFCKALRLTVSDYRSLRVLSGIQALTEPGSTADPADTVRFVELLDRLRKARVSIEELDYVLRHAVSATSAVPPQKAETAVLLEELRTGLQAIVTDQTPAADEPLRAAVENRLSLILEDDPDTPMPSYTRAEKVQFALAIIDRTSPQTTAAQEAFVDANFATFLPNLEDAKATLIRALDDFALTAPPAEDPAPEAKELLARHDYVLTPLLEHLIPRFMDEYLVQKLAAEVELETNLTAELLGAYVPHPSEASLTAIDYFKSDAFVESIEAVTDTAPFADGFAIVERLYKIALVVRQIGLRAEDTAFVLGTGPRIGWIELAVLPLAPTSDADAQDAFAAWYKLFRAYQVQKKRFGQAYSISGILALTNDAAVSRATILDTLITQTGWNTADVEFLAGPEGVDARFASDGGPDIDEAWLLRLDEAFDGVERTGVSAPQLIGWATDTVAYEQARAIKNATKSRYDNADWLGVAAELRDTLREKQRDALQAYVLHREGFEDTDALYAFHLIDTEMGACMITSRLRLAISSVQLFVQRILMNLESGHIEFTKEDAEEWVWRKTYRVWEANRKVFLYPENWIEPELRDDKTPFFKTLEDALLQNEVTDANVEDAYLTYLRSLDEVAHLDVRAMHHDEEADVTHVFARTQGQPHRYFYRQWHQKKEYWTAWERLEIDIEGDHLVPFIYNRRLYLCWPTFIERAVEEAPPPTGDPELPKRYYEIKLQWSEYRQGRWGASHVSDGTITTEMPIGHYLSSRWLFPDISEFVLVPEYSKPENEISIVCSLQIFPVRAFGIREAGRFTLAGCQNVFSAEQKDTSPVDFRYLQIPYYTSNSEWVSSQLVSDRAEELEMVVSEARTASATRSVTVLQNEKKFLITIPGNLTVDFNARAPFSYAADNRTFFVLPKDRYWDWGSLRVPGLPFGNGTEGPAFEVEIDPGYTEIWAGGFLPEEVAPRIESNSPEPDWYLDVAGEDIVYTGTAAGARVVDRAVSSKFTTSDNSLHLTGRARTMSGSTPGWITERNGELADVAEVLTDAGSASWSGLLRRWMGKGFAFHNFYHPHSCLLIKQFNQYGLDGILAPDTRNGPEARSLLRQQAEETYFDTTYGPTPLVATPYPKEDFDFDHDGAYSQYNWELFFHAPLMIATRLMQNQKFAEAQRWFHTIFDPTEVEGAVPKRFWKLKPFHSFDGEANIADLLLLLNEGNENLEKQVATWEADPFDPHAIARLRKVAYMRTTVMKYLDNLIAWGDHLFRQDTLETTNEATQIYVLAAQILGRKPGEVQAMEPEAQTFNALYPHLDDFSNALMADLETAITLAGRGGDDAASTGTSTLDSLLYFCIPNNPQLLGYWDTVADRLFKLRNCMNIEGVRRTLELYEPPIDPGMLVRAAAAGVDLSSALSDLFAPLPAYRFTFMVERAVELTRDVQSLGAALLSALEKKDVEELTMLRAGHEQDLLNAIEEIRERAIEEAELAKEALSKAKVQADERHAFYSGRGFMSVAEGVEMGLYTAAGIVEVIANISAATAAVARTFPDFTLGGAGFASPVGTATYGGSNIAEASISFGEAMQITASVLNLGGRMTGIMANYQRRQEDWDHQADLAFIESEQLQLQLDAADIRIKMAAKELANHQLQIEHAEAVYDFFRTKFTSKDLYSWMTTQISTLYFQAYQLAYDAAKRAERAFRHELGVYDTNFVQFGYWDSLKKGLLSGDRLLKDIRRMQMAFVEQNTRRYEITKHVSLRNLDPTALLSLRETGSCEFTVPEVLFDLDFPGQYGRRTKTVSITIPCVTGPYTTVSAKLTLLNSRVRVDGTHTGSYAYAGIGDQRFLHDLIGVQSISASSAQNDSGLFEFSFRDERYLPFEGTGAISTWRLELPELFRQFDYDTISDVILHQSYTAREGGDSLKAEVHDDLQDSLNKTLDILAESETGLYRMISLRQEFGSEFHRFLHPAADETIHEAQLTIEDRHFPYFLRGRDLTVQDIHVLVKPTERSDYSRFDPEGTDDAVSIQFGRESQPLPVAPLAVGAEGDNLDWSGLPVATFSGVSESPIGEWTLRLDPEGLPDDITIEADGQPPLNPDVVEDILLVLRYEVGSEVARR